MSRAISCVSLIFCTWAWPPLPGAIKEGLTEQVMSAWRSTEKEEPGRGSQAGGRTNTKTKR